MRLVACDRIVLRLWCSCRRVGKIHVHKHTAATAKRKRFHVPLATQTLALDICSYCFTLWYPMLTHAILSTNIRTHAPGREIGGKGAAKGSKEAKGGKGGAAAAAAAAAAAQAKEEEEPAPVLPMQVFCLVWSSQGR